MTFVPPEAGTPIDGKTKPSKGCPVIFIKVGGVECAVSLALNIRPAIITTVVDATFYKVSDYYYGFENPAVATNVDARAMDPKATFEVDQKVLIISAGALTYIVGGAVSNRKLIKFTGTLTGDGYPFVEWDPVTNAAVPDGETGYAKEYNNTADDITNIRVWAEKHGTQWFFFYPIGSDCNG